jgi:hypothetical protein
MVKVINQGAYREEAFKNSPIKRVNIFSGSGDENLRATEPSFKTIGKDENGGDIHSVDVKINGSWVGSAGYERLWNEIREIKYRANAAQAPAAADIAALIQRVFIDITRRAAETPDFTSRIATEITNLEFEEIVPLREIYEYIGKFDIVSGANDPVPLIEQKLGDTDSVQLYITALGWKDSLKNMLFNKLHTMQKVNDAVTKAYTDGRNSLTIGTIVAATYHASQTVAADTTSGATYDVRVYNTIRNAIKTLRALLDNQTARKIVAPTITLLCNSSDTWDIERVIRGQLTLGGTKGTLSTVNLQALPIGEIIEYDQGMTDGKTWGKKTLSYPGVTQGTCYLFVPREYFWILTKRPLTMETGRGSVLQLSTEERAWYACGGKYFKDFLGSSYPDAGTSGYGAIVKVTLPDDSET